VPPTCQRDIFDVRCQPGRSPRPDDVRGSRCGGTVTSDGAVVPAWRSVVGTPWRTVVTTVRCQVMQSTGGPPQTAGGPPQRKDVAATASAGRRTRDVHATASRPLPHRPSTSTQVHSVLNSNCLVKFLTQCFNIVSLLTPSREYSSHPRLCLSVRPSVCLFVFLPVCPQDETKNG